MKKIAIINGPNLNLLGKREPHIYGATSFDDYFSLLKKEYSDVQLEYYQSNIEGELINFMHQLMGNTDGIVLNAGAYTHTSIAIADAITAINIPVVEVHISNVHARESFRNHSYLSAKCVGGIFGLGLEGYSLAIQYLLKKS